MGPSCQRPDHRQARLPGDAENDETDKTIRTFLLFDRQIPHETLEIFVTGKASPGLKVH